MIFVQREGATGTVTFAGDQARILDSAGRVVRDWTSGGVLEGIPQGDGYRLEVRTGGTVTSDALAIGAVVFTMGQSNIQRWFDTPPAGTTSPGIYGMEWDGAITRSVTGGAAQHFTQGYAAALGVPVLIVEGARGGTSLLTQYDRGNGHWLSSAAGSLYANVLARLDQVGGRAELVLWAQGETDASSGVTAAAYANGLAQLMQRILADFTPDRVLIQEIGPHGRDADEYDAVRAAQRQIADAMAGVDIAAFAAEMNTIEDGVHISGASRTLAADRMLVAALALEGVEIARGFWHGSDDPLAGDVHVAGAGRDELRGDGGADSLDGGDGSDVLLGGAGGDTLLGGGGLDIIRGDDGNDVVDGGDEGDVLSGGEGADSLAGATGRDEIWGDAGDDTLTGGAGNDLLAGGAGTDMAVFSGRRAGYSIVSSGGTLRITDIDLSDSDGGQDTLMGVELLRFADGTLDLRSTPAPTLFTGAADAVDFNALTVTGMLPASAYDALDGNDEVTLPGTLADATRVGWDTSRAFDGGAGNDIIIGGALTDTIRGGAGADLLNGVAGADVVDGGAGNDILDGGAGFDVAVFSGSRAQSTAVRNGDGSWTVTGINGTDTLRNIEALRFADGQIPLTRPRDFNADGTSDLLWRGA
ncbi:MAG TPA: sialate O-acetylesterase, partial [Acetobacteraceae bacterium]|nr:sialate O-acetylesterase [Acetobacteraceae bacterium]